MEIITFKNEHSFERGVVTIEMLEEELERLVEENQGLSLNTIKKYIFFIESLKRYLKITPLEIYFDGDDATNILIVNKKDETYSYINLDEIYKDCLNEKVYVALNEYYWGWELEEIE